MEETLESLLSYLEGEYPQPVSRKELLNYFQKDLIHYAWDSGLTENVNLSGNIGELGEPYYALTNKGLEMIVQIKTKRNLESLNHSVEKFDKTSQKYSKIMIILTIVIAFLTTVLLVKEFQLI